MDIYRTQENVNSLKIDGGVWPVELKNSDGRDIVQSRRGAHHRMLCFFPLHGARASSFRMIIPGNVLDGRERISVCVPRSRVHELGSFLILKSARKLALPKQSPRCVNKSIYRFTFVSSEQTLKLHRSNCQKQITRKQHAVTANVSLFILSRSNFTKRPRVLHPSLINLIASFETSASEKDVYIRQDAKLKCVFQFGVARREIRVSVKDFACLRLAVA
jgi:hypothetical protein